MKNGFVFNALKTLVSAILGIIILNAFNIFDYLSFVPEEIKYEVGMATYFSVIESVLSTIINKINDKFTYVEFIFYNKRNEANYLENPIINFSEDVAKISVKISVAGHSSHLRKSLIILKVPEWITIQANSEIVRVADDTHSSVIELSRIVPESGKSEKGTVHVDLHFIRDSKEQKSYTLKGQFKCSGLRKIIKSNFVSNSVEIKP